MLTVYLFTRFLTQGNFSFNSTAADMRTRLQEVSWLYALSILTLTPAIKAKLLWSTTPANSSDVIRTAYPLGNGNLGALLHGEPLAEILTLNVDSLWS